MISALIQFCVEILLLVDLLDDIVILKENFTNVAEQENSGRQND